MKYNCINKNSFGLKNYVYEGTSYEGEMHKEDIERLLDDGIEIKYHNENTNIDYPRHMTDSLYDISYVKNDGIMISKTNLNMIELTILLMDLEKNLVGLGGVNIFESKKASMILRNDFFGTVSVSVVADTMIIELNKEIKLNYYACDGTKKYITKRFEITTKNYIKVYIDEEESIDLNDADIDFKCFKTDISDELFKIKEQFLSKY